MPSSQSTVSSPGGRTIGDRGTRHQRGFTSASIFRRRAGDIGAGFTDESPTDELQPQQRYARAHFALKPLTDDPTDPPTDEWPLGISANSARPEQPRSDAQVSSPDRAPPEIAAPGGVLGGRYVLDRIIGQGGNASVYLARDLRRAADGRSTKNFVALKLLHPAQRSNPHALIRLKREYRQMQLLVHRGIAQVFDLGCDGDVWFLAMELVPGETASAWMRKGVSYADAMRVIRGCCVALATAHSKGILHGDLKPSNVLVLRDGAVKLIDFGSVAASGDRGDDPAAAKVGVTPSYASREVLMGESIEQRDEVYSLACLSYAILSGGLHPFDRQTALDAAQSGMAPPRLDNVPDRVFDVIARGLAMERASRPASVREFLHELRRASKATPAASGSAAAAAVTLVQAPAQAPASQQVPRATGGSNGLTARHYRWGLAGLVVLFVLAGLAVGVMSVFSPAPPPAEQVDDSPAAASGNDSTLAVAAATPVTATTSASPGTSATLHEVSSYRVQDASLSRVVPDSDPDAAVQPLAVPDAPGMVTFDDASIVAGASQPLVAITLRRLYSTEGSALVQWRLEGGSAQPDVDYEGLRPQTVRFFAGQSVRTVFVPLMAANSATASRASRTFFVALQKVQGGPALGAVTRVAVTIH